MKKTIKLTESDIVKILNNVINENVDGSDLFGHDYNELLDNISDGGLMFVEPEDALNDKIEYLNNLKNKSSIKLYRVVYAKNEKDINLNKLGHHFVGDVDDFHDDMLDYLYRNANKGNKKLKPNDIWLIKIKVSPNNIDFYETLLTYSLHPNENEITLENDKNIKVISVSKF